MAFLRLVALLAVATAAGCYSPKQPACAFPCVDDGVCHRDDSPGTCTIPSQIDAGADGPDAGSD